MCNACNRCCHHKAIRVGPYELLRLARRLHLTTTDVIARHTEAGGTVLRTRAEDGACVFLGPRGCTVHPDRPLACRLYPLARWVDPDGTESFGHLQPHPETAGIYGRQGVVDDYLTAQGTAEYFAMGDRYGELYERMVAALERLAPDEAARVVERRAEIDEMDAGTLASSFMDVDATVAAYCREHALAVPDDIEALVELHLHAVDAWLTAFAAQTASASRIVPS